MCLKFVNMPKIIELTVQIDVERVSCPGVWLCQDGRVSLTVFALGTSYQTCLLPPMFPLTFKDVFYFQKRFQETCSLNNICCLLKDETIYCELVQWSEDCSTEECTILAQYLGALNDILFPPNMCSNEGVDLLMRRSKEFPGILSPKIEIATKVRIDEVWNQCHNVTSPPRQSKVTCQCAKQEMDAARQRQVCHTPQYHRNKCYGSNKRPTSASRSRSQSRSGGSQSCCSLSFKEPVNATWRSPKLRCPSPCPPSRSPRPSNKSPCSLRNSRIPIRPCRQYSVYNVQVDKDAAWSRQDDADVSEELRSSDTDKMYTPTEERIEKILLESRYIEEEIEQKKRSHEKLKRMYRPKIQPCVCEICKRYHELFHTDRNKS